MNILDAIAARRSTSSFTGRAVSRDEVSTMIEAALRAPNHRMTQPVRFRVLGAEGRRAYGAVLGARKAKKIEDPVAAQAVIDKVSGAEGAIPTTIVVSMLQNENPEIREEDYATALMGVQNMMLAALSFGLATHIRSGAVMDDPRMRDAMGVAEGERIVAIVHVGEAAITPDAKPRRSVDEVTTWLP